MAAGNTITGNADGAHPWSNIGAAYWVGKPDPVPMGGPQVTTVVYLLSQSFPCSSMNPGSGWDAKVPTGTQVMEFKMAWPTPGNAMPTGAQSYPVILTNPALSPAPPMGKAYAIWGILTSGVMETSATGGSVALGVPNAAKDVPGTFNLTYSGGTLSGSFDAIWCPTGGEP